MLSVFQYIGLDIISEKMQTVSSIKEQTMKKEILVKLELDIYEGSYTNDDLIKKDLETELNCCCNGFDIKEIIINDLA